MKMNSLLTVAVALIISGLVTITAFLAFSIVSEAYMDEEPLTIEETFAVAAQEYELDENMLIAIAKAESGYGESDIAKKRNNWFGWMGNDGKYKSFSTVNDCIWYVAKAMSKRPHESVEAIAEWYNPAFKNVWINLVKSCMAEPIQEELI